jgi:hypothetical protein
MFHYDPSSAVTPTDATRTVEYYRYALETGLISPHHDRRCVSPWEHGYGGVNAPNGGFASEARVRAGKRYHEMSSDDVMEEDKLGEYAGVGRCASDRRRDAQLSLSPSYDAAILTESRASEHLTSNPNRLERPLTLPSSIAFDLHREGYRRAKRTWRHAEGVAANAGLEGAATPTEARSPAAAAIETPTQRHELGLLRTLRDQQVLWGY